jgi:predicted enzyme related to lactoylglutathione lyase
MPQRTSYLHGTPSWVDLATPDKAGSKDFYGSLLGWRFEDGTEQEGFYTMAYLGDAAAAGMMQTDDSMGVPPVWSSYVTVDDIEATVKQVEPAGGQVMRPPIDVLEYGRMAMVVDPTGAVLCLWQPGTHHGCGVVNEPGAFCWSELISPDVEKAAVFYGEIFGWTTRTTEMGPGMTYTEFLLGGESIAGGMAPPAPGMPAYWGVYFAVENTDATLEQATAKGATVMMGPIDVPAGRFAVVRDPQGVVVTFIQLPS